MIMSMFCRIGGQSNLEWVVRHGVNKIISLQVCIGVSACKQGMKWSKLATNVARFKSCALSVLQLLHQ